VAGKRGERERGDLKEDTNNQCAIWKSAAFANN
jgi:hypothetical protein